MFHRVLPLACVVLYAQFAWAQCESWLPTWGDSSFANVQSLATVDHDGPEGPLPPVLYARGSRSSVGTLWRWTYLRWEAVPNVPFGTAMLGLDALAGGFPSGTLLVSGSISTQALMLGAWNGVTFQPVGSTAIADYSSGATLRALTTWDPDGPGPVQPWIIAVGTFTRFGGINTPNIAAWDGSAWRALGPGLGGTLHAAASFDPDGDGPLLPLLAVGDANGQVRVWNGSAWSVLGASFNSQITSLITHDFDGPGGEPPRLCASTRTTSPAWARIGKWNGSAWVEAGANTPFNGTGRLVSLDLDGPGPGGPTLVAVGSTGPSFPDGSRPSLAILGTGGWTLPYGSPNMTTNTNGIVESASVIDPDGPDGPRGHELIVGGNSTIVGGSRGVAYAGLGAWNGERWGPLGNEMTGGRVFRFAWHDEDGPGPSPSALYAAGDFEAAGGELAAGLARWDGVRFVGLGQPTPNTSNPQFISRLVSFDADGAGPMLPRLTGIDVVQSTSQRVVQWQGGTWTALGTLSGAIFDIHAFDADGPGPGAQTLITAGDMPLSDLMRWNGTAWVVDGGVRNGLYHALFDSAAMSPSQPTLYALSEQELLARAGNAWSLFNNTFYVDNYFRVINAEWWDQDGSGPIPAGPVVGAISIAPYYGAAAFDGTAWRQIGTTPLYQVCKGLGFFDPDADGPIPDQLFRGSDSTLNGGLRRLADNDWALMGQGIAWSPASSEFTQGVYTFLTVDPDNEGPTQPELWIAGGFTHAGGVEAMNFARWRFETLPPAFVQFPVNAVLCPGGTAAIGVIAQGADTFTWLIKDASVQGGWRTLVDGPLVINGEVVGQLTGTGSTTLGITASRNVNAAEFRVRLNNACHAVTSSSVRVRICYADFNCSGGMPDDADVEAFFEAWNGGESIADVNGSGGTPDDADVDAFFNVWNTGC